MMTNVIQWRKATKTGYCNSRFCFISSTGQKSQTTFEQSKKTLLFWVRPHTLTYWHLWSNTSANREWEKYINPNLCNLGTRKQFCISEVPWCMNFIFLSIFTHLQLLVTQVKYRTQSIMVIYGHTFPLKYKTKMKDTETFRHHLSWGKTWKGEYFT